ncbi:hypothetical protein F5148DRAFT_1195675 [Russula earlei]|uniref:Uncharacterized protein n=1 Tax=Russula earlei TaxID=71964 RepID=A0ACC0UA69_9AGAM|nr:hypothetical protein F5148DRAFT_1195675 [Russula earlei]
MALSRSLYLRLHLYRLGLSIPLSRCPCCHCFAAAYGPVDIFFPMNPTKTPHSFLLLMIFRTSLRVAPYFWGYLRFIFLPRPAARHIIIDQQRMKERLGVIVRAKEGKMVNVNAPLPFNLNSNHAATTNHNKHSRLSRLRTRSPQPSLDMERQSVASSASASASASHELDEDMRWPTLNVRIVRGVSALARGRPINRDAVMHGLETGGGESAAEAEGQPVQAPSDDGAGRGREAAPIPGTTFKIQNVGSLSRSWGD